MDYLSELENELARFTKSLLDGIGSIQTQTFENPQDKEQSIASLSAEIAAAHNSIISTIQKIPEEMFKNSQEQQEAEIKHLQEKYAQTTERLRMVHERAAEVKTQLEASLEGLQAHQP